MQDMNLFTYQERVAYAAGILDGEGCISIYKRPTGYFSVIVKVAMTNKSPLLFLHNMFGGSIGIRPVRGNRKPQWDWNICGRDCEIFLEEVFPCLLVKELEAALALIMISSLKGTDGTGKPVPQARKDLRELLLLECKAAKHNQND